MWQQCLREESDLITTTTNSKDLYHFYANIIIFMQVFKNGKPTKKRLHTPSGRLRLSVTFINTNAPEIKDHTLSDTLKTKVHKTVFKGDRFLSCIISSSVSKNNLSASWTKMDGKVKQANGLNWTSFLNRYETHVTAAESINVGVDMEYRRRAHFVFWEQHLWFWISGFWVLHHPSPSDNMRDFWATILRITGTLVSMETQLSTGTEPLQSYCRGVGFTLARRLKAAARSSSRCALKLCPKAVKIIINQNDSMYFI